MADQNNTTDPQKDQDNPQITSAPSESQDGKAEQKQKVETEAKEQVQVPEKFKDKSPEEIVKSYIELEKSFGEHSKKVGEYSKKLEQWEALGEVIKSNPDLTKRVDSEIKRLTGSQDSQQTDDVRRATENQLIENFETKYGLNHLPVDKRQQINEKISAEMNEILGLRGSRSISDLPLDQLPKILHKAYRLAIQDDVEERARLEALLQQRQNSEAVMGSIPSSGANSETIKLTPEQREVARKMGISEKDYIESLKKIEKGE